MYKREASLLHGVKGKKLSSLLKILESWQYALFSQEEQYQFCVNIKPWFCGGIMIQLKKDSTQKAGIKW